MKKTLSLLGALIFTSNIAHASLVIQSFNDIGDAALTNSIALNALDVPGGVSFTTSYQQNTGVVVARTNDLVVGLTNYISGQSGDSQHWSAAATDTSSGSARRSQTRGVPTMSGTIWFSFLASLNTPNGDVALTFNGNFDGSGRSSAGGGGMRVGLGNNSVAGLRGALGVGPHFISGNAELAGLQLITNNVNGAITAGGFVPTNGTAGLVLGRIDFDTSGYPRVVLWYNPDVPDAASLPAPTLSFVDTNFLFVPTSLTRIGYQVVRSATLGVQHEVIDNVKVSDEANAFDIVYKNAALSLPTVAVTGTVLTGNETGPTNIIFTITTATPVASPLSINYTLSGVATNGFDGVASFVGADYADTNFNTNTQISSVTIPTGGSNAVVTVSVIDDAVPEGDESVTLTIQPNVAYIIGGGGSAAGQIVDNNDAGVMLQYMFTGTLAPQVWDTNLVASAFNATGVGGAFSSTAGYFISPSASIRASGDSTAATANDALANGDFMAFSVEPLPGQGLSLTNIEFQAVYGNYLFLEPGAAAAVVFLRSSLDNYASDLGSWTLQPDNILFPNIWYGINQALPAAFTNVIGLVTFRLYVYDDTATQAQVGVRIDNLYLRGGSFPSIDAQQVSLSVADVSAAEPSDSGQFTISRIGSTNNSLTVNYTVAGTAVGGVDYTSLSGTAIIPAGETNVAVSVLPIDDELVEPTETVELTLGNGVDYGIIGTSSGTVNIADNGDIGGLVAYMFNEANNGAGSLSNVAAATTFQPDKVSASKAVAGAGLGNFGANNVAGVGHGYATSAPHSGASGMFMRGDYLSTTASDAVSSNDYVNLTLAPQPGGTLTLTNFIAYLKFSVAAGQTNWAFLRSSADSFTSDLGSVAVSGTPTSDPSYSFWSVPLSVTAATTATEFRIYFYSTRSDGTDITRLDDVAFQGFGTAAPVVQPIITHIAVTNSNVILDFTGSTNDASSAFKLQSSTNVVAGYADDNSALVTGSAGVFQATTAVNGEARYFRIRR